MSTPATPTSSVDRSAVAAEIDRLRAEIDAADQELLELLARRWRLTTAIMELRTSAGGPPTDLPRETAILERVAAFAQEAGIPVSLATDIYLVWFNTVRDTLARRPRR